jgi:hypothetical protein
MTKARANATAEAAKGDLRVGSGTNATSVLGVGSNTQVLTADSTQATGMKWAAANLTWTNRLQATANNRFTQIATNGSNIYVATQSNGALYSSPDGITWTSRTSGFGANQINDVQYGNGLFVAVGNNGTITTSTDGTTWTARTSNMSTNQINAVAYANSVWVAVGAGGGATNTGGITYSSDGLTWTRKSQTPTVGTTYYCLVWNGTNWIVGAGLSTNNYLYATTPSGTWTAAVTVGASTISYGILWDGTRHIWQENYQYYYNTGSTLASALTWVVPTTPVNSTIANFKLYSGVIYKVDGALQTITPSSTSNPITSVPSLLPSTNYYYDSSANANSFNNGAVSILITSAGYILGDAYGRIFTSF